MSYALDDREIRARCTRFLSYHHPRTAPQWLLDLSREAKTDELDFYGSGGSLAEVEGEFATLLGKPAAVFMPSGTMAQQAALRAWADLSGRRTVAIHPQSHIHRDEQGAYERLHGLTGVPLTFEPRYPNAEDFHALAEPVGALTLELPLRRLTYGLPEWSQVESLVEAARSAGTKIHLDGARLLESCPYYERTPAGIASIFDSVYVSVYKGLGGIAGAVLAGPTPFVEAASLWRLRHGGRLHSMFPFAVAASAGLKRHAPRIPDYITTARTLAEALADVPGVHVLPRVPCINAFQLHFDSASVADLRGRHAAQAASTGNWLFNWFAESPIPGAAFADVVIGDAFDRWTVAEAAQAIRNLVP